MANEQFTVARFGAIPLDVRSNLDKARAYVLDYIASHPNSEPSRVVFGPCSNCPTMGVAAVSYHFDGPSYAGNPQQVCELWEGHLAIRPYTATDAESDGIVWHVAA